MEVKMSDTETLLPVYHKNGSNILKMLRKSKFCSFRISIPKFVYLSAFASFFSFFFCVFWSIAYNFEEANATHCSVENFLPSISAAIGHFYPQIYIWNSTILLNLFPRLKISTMYFHYFCSVINERYYHLYFLAWVLNVSELWSLLGLSLVTSTVNYPFHAFCFICFLFCSMLHMILTCYLLKFKRKVPAGTLESKSLKWKFKTCAINIFCFFMAGYFFQRHNTQCERGVYSVFAFFEYGVVLSNIVFHRCAVWDFHDKIVTVTLSSRGLETEYNPPFKSLQFGLK